MCANTSDETGRIQSGMAVDLNVFFQTNNQYFSFFGKSKPQRSPGVYLILQKLLVISLKLTLNWSSGIFIC